jgi:C4-dicarboxylate-specific signal transduction histidine kinase
LPLSGEHSFTLFKALPTNRSFRVKKKVTCWEFFKCDEKECPVYRSKELLCWLVSRTHCRKEIQGKFLEKMEICLDCGPFRANMDVDSMEETLKVVNEQFIQFREMVDERDKELEGISMELALGLSQVFEALKEISSGDPSVRISETSELELVTKLKHMVNLTAEELSEIVNLSHEFAIGLAEHFDVLHRVSKGELTMRVSGTSPVELLESLKKTTNHMIDNIYKEIDEHQKTGEQLRKRTRDLSERVKDLNCLYAISGLVMRPGISFDKLVQEIVDLIPGSWHHPEVACARIVLQGQEFKTENFRETVWKQTSDIAANGKRVGTLEVCYLEQRPEADEGPFMKEDRNLINAIAERMGKIIEGKQADEERDKLESQLMQASKMSSIGEMAAGVAHEINNPVAVILGFAELLLERFPEDSKEFEMLKTIERQGDNCKRIVDNLLAFARVPKEVTTETDVAQDLQKVADVVTNTLLTEKVDLKIDVEEDLPKVVGDRQQLEQVFLNLINNAVAAMDGGGMLTISAHRSDDRVNIEFNDTGRGISPKHMNKVFEPFFTTRKVGEGTGLGLSVSYAIVKK